MAELKYRKHIVTDLKTDQYSAEYAAKYSEWATRILWLDDTVVDGAFQMNCSWYLKPNISWYDKSNYSMDSSRGGHAHDHMKS